MAHLLHDAIARNVRGWYLEPHPAMGYTAEPRWFGAVRGNSIADFASATVTSLDVADVSRFVEEVLERFGGRDVRVQIDSETMNPSLDAALVSAGLVRRPTTVHLVHEGPLPQIAAPEGFGFEQIEAAGIPEFSQVKLMAFASSETPPASADVEHENGFRQAEFGEPNGFAIGRLDGAAAGIIGWYGGEDTLIFLVATRVPYRRRGLASAMVLRVLQHCRDRGDRSVLISADADDDPVDLYRRLGFTDEVHRQHGYELSS